MNINTESVLRRIVSLANEHGWEIGNRFRCSEMAYGHVLPVQLGRWLSEPTNIKNLNMLLAMEGQEYRIRSYAGRWINIGPAAAEQTLDAALEVQAGLAAYNNQFQEV